MKKLFITAISAILLVLQANANLNLYGVTQQGGAFGYGTLFKYNVSGNVHTVLKSFNWSDGAHPMGQLVLASDNKFYGTTNNGGSYGNGVIFEFDPATDTYSQLANFNYSTTGSNPYGSLVQLSNGKLVGTNSSGGTYGYGTIWEYDITGNTLTTLYNFDYYNSGGYPYSSIMVASNGKLYGTTTNGGAYSYGTLFEFDESTSTFNLIRSFNSYDGGYAQGGHLTETSNGDLFGTTTNGGVNGYGTLFQYNIYTAVFTKRLDFDYYTNGAYSYGAALLFASNGLLYGTNASGGAYGYGCLYSFDPVSGNTGIVHNFNYYADGISYNSVMQATDGNLYGLTYYGGSYYYSSNTGTLYQYNLSTNAFTTKVNFDYCNGAHPYFSGLSELSDTLVYTPPSPVGQVNLYGVTQSGGTSGSGVLFKFGTTDNMISVKNNFDYSSGGAPIGKLLYAADGKFYGTTNYGGNYGYGVVFEYDPISETYTKNADFDYSTTGGYGYGAPIQLPNGKIVGTNTSGGTYGYGTIWEYDIATNTIAALYSFDNSTGSYPYGSVMQASNGKLYGTTWTGGTSGHGTLYEFDLQTSTYAVKQNFDYYNKGAYPNGKLVETSNGDLYGGCYGGGANSNGTLFQYNVNTSTFTNRFNFSYSSGGAYYYSGGLCYASNGLLYGTNVSGAQFGYGCLFSFDPASGTLNNLHDFNYYSDGIAYNPLMQASNGNLYGMTYYGSMGNCNYYYYYYSSPGTIFEYNIGSNTYATKATFRYANGAYPFWTALTEAGNFSDPCVGFSVSLSAGPIACNGGTTTAAVSVNGGTASYTYQWNTGTTAAYYNNVTAGVYSVKVTDANNCSATASVTITEPAALVASSSAGSIACNGGSTTVNVSATGGTSPYSGTGSFTASAGTHSYTVTDANGCTSVTSVTITEPAVLAASSAAGSIACNGGTTTVNVSATGGTAPYSGTGSFTASAGTHSYTVTDANGCSSVTSVTITEPAVLSASSSAGSVACNGGTTIVNVSATGGTVPYSGTGSFTVSAGTHSYTVTDANGCTSVSSITITEPTVLVASSSAGSISCNGGTTTVNVTATGGTAPYSGTGSFTASAGTHSYTVTDANGCTSVTSVTITEPTALVASAGAQQSVYFGYNPMSCAALNGSATGGTAPYTYLWSTGSASASITVCPSEATTYTLTVTDANGCVSTSTVKVCVTNVKCSKGGNAVIYYEGGKVLVCHVPDGDYSKRVTLCIAPEAVPDHLAHGDQLGLCGETASCNARVRHEETLEVIEAGVMNLMAYPNPFNEATIVRFSLPEAGKASLKVYNMLGEEVQVLFEGDVLKDEAREVVFKGTDFANGIYMVKLMTESGDIKAEKVLLSK